ncbi:phosphotransferase [Pleionea sp. CnH1-48]|uniref:phosphotransferase n=1 Tax=Pleionea sp. CnH1-48 TaxID=2954494 RepID=UPI002097896A|nr:phosphotransferase [Pleionea sp. CnH1-48]MCO7224370.1 phosphotransferase [Pleionea sp. CnH1-48]
MVNTRLQHILAELQSSGNFETPLTIQPVAGGEVNHSFVLLSGEQRFFLKLFEQDELLPAGRDAQYELQLRLSKHHLAMEPVYFNHELGCQVESWFDGDNLLKLDAAIEQKIDILAETLAAIHNTDINAQPLPLPEVWQRYIEAAKLDIDPSLRDRVERAERIFADTKTSSKVLCHNDLSLQHVGLSSSRMVFDWEYAAMGNRYFDLASCIDVNGFDGSQAQLLLNKYCGFSGIEEEHALASTLQQDELVKLTCELWFRVVGQEG